MNGRDKRRRAKRLRAAAEAKRVEGSKPSALPTTKKEKKA